MVEVPQKPERKKSIRNEIREWVKSFAIALAVMLFITTLIAQPVRVKGSSMRNTLADHEFMLVTKFEYLLADPARYDVVICRYPDRGLESFVKRIVGVPGDTVSLEGGRLYVNGEAVEEAYIDYRSSDTMQNVTVGEGEYFVMGDNRPNSNDSRYVGLLSRNQILGKVRYVLWPLDSIRAVD